jgi:membrane protease YdiL (CAAX protease family)
MHQVISFVKRHPLVTFFGLAYGLSWGSYAILSGPLLFIFGPLLAALIVASVTRGKDGLRDVLRRSLRWRVGLTWYAAALCVPVAITLAAVALNLLLGARVPTAAPLGPWYSLIFLFPQALLDAPLGEEAGWRGFALPHMAGGRSPLATTLILGLLLAAWHVPIALADRTLAAPYLIGALASAVVINWVYYQAHESAFLAIVYHTAQNTIGGWYLFRLFSGPDTVRLWWLFAAVYCGAALSVILVDRRTWQARKPATFARAEVVTNVS